MKSQGGGDIIVGTSIYRPLNVGQKTTLTKDNIGIYHFSDPVVGQDGYLEAVNGCPLPEDMAIGFSPPGSGEGPTPLLYFNEIGRASSFHLNAIHADPECIHHRTVPRDGDHQSGSCHRDDLGSKSRGA
ncbi:hypothetical protein PAXRUDRAFT_836318 [Paxillus rubicundulus Ve08.2h10]|uniref:Uncharacterized protein n=1 Tax=Paxillus rubicundulus Ve08.2h10 TaxID=930991 RepID=A0A0D0D012_9AGAM|nr:hypothetical protein PAXRUDRAFT_836318 [Paxillus rubicundulus Ve08.2h10]